MSLVGRTVVITRAKTQSAALAAALQSRGAAVVEMPVISIVAPLDEGVALRDALRAEYDWIVITSPNGVDAVVAAADGRRITSRIAVVGSGTASRLATHGLSAALVPARFVAEGLVDAFPEPPAGGGRVLVAQAEEARDVVVNGVRAKGWHVAAVVAYRNVAVSVSPEVVEMSRRADAVVFTSSSTVERFVAVAGVGATPPVVACIGPVTEATARRLGIGVDVVGDPHTIEGVVDALDRFFAVGSAHGDVRRLRP